MYVSVLRSFLFWLSRTDSFGIGAKCTKPVHISVRSFMTTRVTRKSVTFVRPFVLNELDGEHPAGTYIVETKKRCLKQFLFAATDEYQLAAPTSINGDPRYYTVHSGGSCAPRCGAGARCEGQLTQPFQEQNTFELSRMHGRG